MQATAYHPAAIDPYGSVRSHELSALFTSQSRWRYHCTPHMLATLRRLVFQKPLTTSWPSFTSPTLNLIVSAPRPDVMMKMVHREVAYSLRSRAFFHRPVAGGCPTPSVAARRRASAIIGVATGKPTSSPDIAKRLDDPLSKSTLEQESASSRPQFWRHVKRWAHIPHEKFMTWTFQVSGEFINHPERVALNSE